MKISINKPCHENWDIMNPNEQGAFCLSCQKNVVDFSKKNIEEIKDFFTKKEDTRSVCGRFEESQLTEMTFDHFFTEFRNWKFFQKAAIVVFFVFGFSLFGYSQSNPKDIKMGKVKWEEPDTTKTKCVKDTTVKPTKGNIKVVPEKHIKGEIEATPVKPRNHPPKKQSPKPVQPLMGDVMIDNKH
jgi:hypothetical protein